MGGAGAWAEPRRRQARKLIGCDSCLLGRGRPHPPLQAGGPRGSARCAFGSGSESRSPAPHTPPPSPAMAEGARGRVQETEPPNVRARSEATHGLELGPRAHGGAGEPPPRGVSRPRTAGRPCARTRSASERASRGAFRGPGSSRALLPGERAWLPLRSTVGTGSEVSPSPSHARPGEGLNFGQDSLPSPRARWCLGSFRNLGNC